MDWLIKILIKIPLKKTCNWALNKLQNFFLGKKSLKIELHCDTSGDQEPSTALVISTVCSRTLTFVYHDRKINQHYHTAFGSDIEQVLMLYRMPKTPNSPFKIVIPERSARVEYVNHHPVVDGGDLLRKRLENGIFYIDSKLPERLPIPNTSEWIEFVTGAKHMYLLDTDRVKYYVGEEGIKEAKEQAKLKKQRKHKDGDRNDKS